MGKVYEVSSGSDMNERYNKPCQTVSVSVRGHGSEMTPYPVSSFPFTPDGRKKIYGGVLVLVMSHIPKYEYHLAMYYK